MKKRKLLSMVLTLCMLLSLMPAMTITASAGVHFSGGDGTSGTPYQISTTADLEQLSANVNAGNSYVKTIFELTEDITLTGDWVPIGTLDNEFSGTFDGKNHLITGIKIGTSTTPNESYYYAGLFGNTSGSVIKNLGVNVEINSSKGTNCIGGLVGSNENGTITNCYAIGDVTGGYAACVGGLIGYNDNGTITKCYAIGDVTGGYAACVGGLIGYNDNGTIKNCYATGDVTGGYAACVGGLIGWGDMGTITNCYATGNATGGDAAHVGGLVGRDMGTITNCYATGNATGGDAAYVGGLVGMNSDATTTNCYATGNVTAGNVTAGNGGSLPVAPHVGGLVGCFSEVSKGTVIYGYWNNEAIHTVSGATIASTGIGTEPPNPIGTVIMTGMTSTAMKSADFATTLNNRVSSSAYNTWTTTTAYPTFSTLCAPIYTMSASTLTAFASQTDGYATAPTEQAVTITNTGNQSITLTQPTSVSFTITSLSVITITAGNTATFTVQPKTGLGVGAYTETINIIGTNSASASLTAQFSVTSAGGSGGHNSNSGGATADTIKTTIKSGEEVNTGNLSQIVTDKKELTVKSNLGTVVFDTKALSAIDNQTTEKITVVIENAKEEKLSDTQKTMVGDRPVYDLTVLSGGKKISDFKGGNVTVTLPYELRIGEKAEGVVVWYLADDGTLTPVKCAYDERAKAATFTVSHFSKYVVGYAAKHDAAWVNPFKDVAANAWYHEAVGFAYQNELMLGKTETFFSPDGSTTRSMIVSILWRMEGEPASTTSAAFKDVNANAWYSTAVAWASKNCIVNGYTSEKFAPEDEITREQMATILYNYAKFKGMDVSKKSDLSIYNDSAKVSSWAENALAYANAEGLISGSNATTLNPKGTASRAQVAAILERFIENSK